LEKYHGKECEGRNGRIEGMRARKAAGGLVVKCGGQWAAPHCSFYIFITPPVFNRDRGSPKMPCKVVVIVTLLSLNGGSGKEEGFCGRGINEEGGTNH